MTLLCAVFSRHVHIHAHAFPEMKASARDARFVSRVRRAHATLVLRVLTRMRAHRRARARSPQVFWVDEMNMVISGSWDKTLKFWSRRQQVAWRPNPQSMKLEN